MTNCVDWTDGVRLLASPPTAIEANHKHVGGDANMGGVYKIVNVHESFLK